MCVHHDLARCAAQRRSIVRKAPPVANLLIIVCLQDLVSILFGGTDSTGRFWAEGDSVDSTWRRQALPEMQRDWVRATQHPRHKVFTSARCRCSYQRAGLSDASYAVVDVGCDAFDTTETFCKQMLEGGTLAALCPAKLCELHVQPG